DGIVQLTCRGKKSLLRNLDDTPDWGWTDRFIAINAEYLCEPSFSGPRTHIHTVYLLSGVSLWASLSSPDLRTSKVDCENFRLHHRREPILGENSTPIRTEIPCGASNPLFFDRYLSCSDLRSNDSRKGESSDTQLMRIQFLKEVKSNTIDSNVEIAKSQALIDLLGPLDRDFKEYYSISKEDLSSDRPSSCKSDDNGYV
ncbi:hypothetical protein HAX54_049530, partial [Datura stramonium]|nr:hypothetical protein [Datura stramonium]